MIPDPPGHAEATARRLDPKIRNVPGPRDHGHRDVAGTDPRQARFPPNLVSAWLTSFAIGVVVAVPTAILVAPPVQRLVGQLTGPLRHPPPEDRR